MSNEWNHPLKPASHTVFFDEPVTVIKGQSRWDAYREKYGTPHTAQGPTGLRPVDVALTLRPDLVKSSMVPQLTGGASNHEPVNVSPALTSLENPNEVVKSYLAWNGSKD